MGLKGVKACLQAGVNDIGGTLINESITRAAGASHGQGVDVDSMYELAQSAGRELWQRTTLYKELPKSRVSAPETSSKGTSIPVHPATHQIS